MPRVLKIILSLLLVVGALYGAAKGFMHYRVKAALDDLALQAGPHGSLSYGAIETDLRGRVTVRELSFRLAESPDELRIGQVHVVGPDALFFLDPRNDWSGPDGTPPPRLKVHVGELAVPLGSAPGKDPTDACGVNGLSDPQLLRAIGLEQPLLDGEFGWELDADNRRLQAQLGFDLPGMQTMSAEIELDDVSPAGLQAGEMPKLRGFDLRFRVDPGFGNKFALECARRRGVTPDEFKQALLAEQLQTAAAAGLELGGGLRFALEHFYTKWGEVRLSARPVNAMGMMSLMFLPPERLIEALNLNLRVNDAVISDVSFAWQPGAGAPGSLGALVGAAPPEGAAAPAPPRRQRLERYWVDVQPARLAQHLQRDVRLHTADQPPRTGMLEAINGQTAAVQQRVHGGRFTAHVPLQEITRAEVQLQRVVER